MAQHGVYDFRPESLDFEVTEVTSMAQAKVHYTQFFHRKNPDSSLDSICGFCYLMAGHAENEQDLREAEKGHRCTEKRSNILPFVERRQELK